MTMNNTSTNKKYNNIQPDPVKKGQTPGFVGTPNFGGTYKGQVSGTTGDQTFAKPMNMGAPSEIGGLAGTHNDIGELSGFITDGYLDKNNQAFGEAAKLNFLPPGMDISNQENVEIHNMPLRVYSGGVSYPADGWPNPRDIPE